MSLGGIKKWILVKMKIQMSIKYAKKIFVLNTSTFSFGIPQVHWAKCLDRA